ncbi:alternate signal-mediated exported protein, RER_14450 family [Gordonia malaquae]|uniref:Alternate-type signal peptide domain-containing protein n=1 Tax=Gordonia malaquae NBRC 108250 TaxID=1223542 RepID=M3TI49_GORML|nr:alternate-type signal peptide domain-containing protein [Gordonia malaquae]GAC81181.1 hypothetical protein GM1_030_00070 [Gordonia malaquae NBRC 108250]SEE21652.1 alternate signal-mediated exported protein, RER_14450 family [Gordonia malaquae]
MNKVTKGALAAAAGAAILAGGAGTMAAWNSSDDIAGGNISAGQLNITQVGTGSWSVQSGGPFDPNTDKLAPGAVVVYTADYNITAEGVGLTATLSANEVSGSTGDANLLADLDVEIVNTGNNTITSSGTRQIQTKVTFNEDSDNSTQNKSVSLAGVTVLLQQN